MTVSRFSLVLIVFAAACAGQTGATATPAATTSRPAVSPAASHQTASAAEAPQTPAPAAGDQTIAGTVAETIDAGQYTYVRVQTAAGDEWMAAPAMTFKNGERITATIDMPMDNFHSKTLNRDFPLIYFVSQVARAGEPLPAVAEAPAGTPPAEQVAVAKNAPPPGGMSIADLWANRKTLSGKTVLVRGTVVKVNNQIMGKNWFHLQDGSGAADTGTQDITITSSGTVQKGDVVTVSGTLAIDKDFGAGYAYAAIVESATVTSR